MIRIIVLVPFALFHLHCQKATPIIDPARYHIEICALAQDSREASLRLPAPDGSLLDLERPAITNEHIVAIYREYSEYTGQPTVRIVLNNAGRLIFANLTHTNINKPLAIIINGVIVSAPIVREEIRGGELVITGDMPQLTGESPYKE